MKATPLMIALDSAWGRGLRHGVPPITRRSIEKHAQRIAKEAEARKVKK